MMRAGTLATIAVVGAVSHAAATPAVGGRLFDPSQGGSIVEDDTPSPLVPPISRDRVWVDVDPGDLSVADTRIVYLNRCEESCFLTPGTSSSIENITSVIERPAMLTPFKDGDATWDLVVACLRDVLSPFDMAIVETDPGATAHFEIMIAGHPRDLGLSATTGGISPFSCAEFIPNSIVFAFSDVWNGDVENMCATAAQELAHSFALDHVTDASDPLTYFSFEGRRRFKDAQLQCGSDCGPMSGLPIGRAPMGQTCTGPNIADIGPQNHTCTCGGETQNAVATINELFGPGAGTPPSVKIRSPRVGDRVVAGFRVEADVADSDGIDRVDLIVNGDLAQTVAAPGPNQPFTFAAPADLRDGTQTVRVVATDSFGLVGEARVQVVIGEGCGDASDCPLGTDECIAGRCVAGPGAAGGLGTECTSSSQCVSQDCTQTTVGAFCVEACELGAEQCPAGFGCLDTGATSGLGVCFPGYDDGGGCLSTSGGGSLALALGVVVLAVRRRRRR